MANEHPIVTRGEVAGVDCWIIQRGSSVHVQRTQPLRASDSPISYHEQLLIDLCAVLAAPSPSAAEAGRWIPFNVNAQVRFKITDYGQQQIDKKDAEINDFITARGGSPIGPRYKKDAEGWSETQLWCLMEDLGQFCRLGGDPPFETTILLNPEDTPR